VRLGIRVAPAGSVSFGAGVPGDPLLSVAGGLPAVGGEWHYQAWYRDTGAFCTSATWNLSNGLSIDWNP
jgi:hypothetical protein